MANINKIKLSGTTYNIQDLNATKTVELTQAEYDALSPKDPNVFYIITDAEAGDLSNYYTKTETDNAITAATSTKQDTLVSGTNIKTINSQSILGEGNIEIQGGGGKAIEAGTNISITTGETADTINCTLPITLIKQGTSTFGDRDNLTIFNLNETNEIKHTGTTDNIIIGHSNKIGNDFDPSSNNFILGNYNNLNQGLSGNNPKFNFIVGDNNTIGKSYRENVRYTALFGTYLTPKNNYEYDFGKYNNSVSGSSTFGDSGNTLFSVGNGTSESARHNAFEIRQNGDIYINKDGQDVKLQDQLGGGGSSYTAGDGIDISNDVISVTGKVDTSAITTTITSSSTDAQVPSAKAVYDQLGGLKLVKLTQSEYDSLSTKDNSTLYVIVN